MNETSCKKWCIRVLSLTALGLLLAAVMIFVVDPFFHYHPPLPKLSYSFSNQDYVNPGIVRQFEYDALITGTSMTQNFRPSLFSELLGEEAIKVPFSGGKSRNFYRIIDLAMEKNDSLQAVYLGLDLNMLDEIDAEMHREPLPEYLYDDNPFNDVSYLLNKSALILNAGTVIVNTLEGLPSMTWDEYSRFSSPFALEYNGLPERNEEDALPRDELIRRAARHLELNIIPLLEASAATRFNLFFPPYSILYWHGADVDGLMAILRCTVETLLEYDNVRLFFPMNDERIVTDYDNYYDLCHYKPHISDELVYAFRDGTYVLTRENYQEELLKMEELVARHYAYLLELENED